MKNFRQIRQAIILSLVMLMAWMLPLFGGTMPAMTITADAASVDYPAQLMNLASKDNSAVLTENGTTDGSSVSMKALGSDLSPSW